MSMPFAWVALTSLISALAISLSSPVFGSNNCSRKLSSPPISPPVKPLRFFGFRNGSNKISFLGGVPSKNRTPISVLSLPETTWAWLELSPTLTLTWPLDNSSTEILSKPDICLSNSSLISKRSGGCLLTSE